MICFKTQRTKTYLLVWLCSFIPGLIFGGNPMPNEQNQKNTFVMSAGEETSIQVKSSEEFSIKIKSNPSTGYAWTLHLPKEEEEILVKLQNHTVEETSEESKQMPMGASTYEIFTLEALAPGKTIIQLHYHRPWEKNVPPIKKHKVVVTIK
jgi:inhibitor of cysteine peptidase